MSRAATAVPLLEKRPRSGERGKTFAPLSFSQQQLWYVSQFQSGAVAYNQPVAWRLAGKINPAALEQSLNAIIRRHEALRTTFPQPAGEPIQCIHPDLPLALRHCDLRNLPEAECQTRLQELLFEESRYGFDLANELLLRATLLQTADQEYIFILVVHHIVCDGWSMGILIKELTHFYHVFSADTLATLPELPIQYADFAEWQREWLQGEPLHRQLSYWKQQLNGVSALDLPADRQRPPVPGFHGSAEFFHFPEHISHAFKALSAKEEVFFFMALLAAFQTLLHRYTGQSDIVIGSPVACRKRSRVHRSIGLFVNVMALRADFSGDPTFRDLLKQVRDVVMGAYQNQDLPFETLVKELHPERGSSSNPLFQIILDQVDPRWIALDLDGVKSEWFPVDNKTSKFDITLAWFDSPEGLRGWLEYDTDLFDAATMQRLLGHYQTLIESIVANPDQRVSQLPLLTPAERHQLLIQWNDTKADYPRDSCIHDLFELRAEITPDAIAIEDAGTQQTYKELNRKANQLAHYLRRSQVTNETPVGVCLERSCETVIALLAILKAGAAYVPLDPVYPQQRLDFMMNDAGLRIVLTQECWLGALSQSAKAFCLDRDWTLIAQESEENPRCRAKPDDLAYLIYTSGSTGQPKGVAATHRGPVNRFGWMWNEYPFEPGEVACAKTSLNFVDAVWETFGPMLKGIRTVMIPDEAVKDPPLLISLLAKYDVTRIVLVPSLLRALLDAEPNLQSRLPRLKYWVSSGEVLTRDLVDRFYTSMPHGILINLYGSSEVSADVTCYDTRTMKPGDQVLIGRPIANTRIYILDQRLEPVPVGIPGELCVSGDGLARGYWNRPEQTADRFLADPFSAQRGSRLYRTGDRARYRSDGSLELLGRMDHQVKIRGFRIELGEIESALKQHPSLEEVAVVAQGEPGQQQLIAYITQKSQESPGPHACGEPFSLVSQLRRYLQERLPDHMIPSAFVILEALPLMPNGKLDRRALPTPQTARPELVQDFVEPETPAERAIQAIWREVLKLDRVGAHDNFFDLGGHSLLQATVQRKLIAAFSHPVSIVDLFRYPTISSLARYLSQNDAAQRPLTQAQARVRKQKDALLRRQAHPQARAKL